MVFLDLHVYTMGEYNGMWLYVCFTNQTTCVCVCVWVYVYYYGMDVQYETENVTCWA